MRRTGNPVKKTYNLPQELIAHAKRHFGVRTETEAIIRALEQIAYMDRVEKAVRATAGKLPLYKPLR